MPVNVNVTHQEALRAFGDLNIQALLKKVGAGFDPDTGIALERKHVDISPKPSKKSAKRTITWHLNMMVAESDEDHYEGFKKIVDHLVTGAGGLASSVAMAQAGAPLDVRGALAVILQTMEGIENVLEHAQAVERIKIAHMKVGLTDRGGQPVTLRARLLVDATWACDDPDDSDNKAWVETETLSIGTIGNARSKPNKWNGANWDPTKGAPARHMGRAFMEPHGKLDKIGAFKTEPGANPRPALMEVTAGPIDADETTIDSDISVTVQASDTVIVAIDRVILEIEAVSLMTEEEAEHARIKEAAAEVARIATKAAAAAIASQKDSGKEPKE